MGAADSSPAAAGRTPGSILAHRVATGELLLLLLLL
jgi:hypothetical protein